MKFISIIPAISLLLLLSCKGQQNNKQTNPEFTEQQANGPIGGDCEEGYCELLYYGLPAQINETDTSAGWFETGKKLLLTGTVYQLDGKTPAPGVIIYYHHTDNNGYYSPGDGSPLNSTRHGHIRGWVKTDSNGRYSIYTIRPGPYPKVEDPEHIHLIIKEPDISKEYWIDDVVFDDDKRLLPYRKKHPEVNPRGGSGTVRILLNNGMQIAEHDIILGLNIPNYPKKKVETISGLNIGEDQPSFSPYHAWGPDKGTTTCPVCKYGRYHGILYFVGNSSSLTETKEWLQFLEKESVKRANYLKVYLIFENDKPNQKEILSQLEQLGKELSIKNSALTVVPSWQDKESEAILNKINPSVKNTFVIYKHRSIVDKYINLQPAEENFALISQALERTKGNYFNLSEPEYE